MSKRLRQREFCFTNWGGKRKGAGRKPKGAKAMAPHTKRERLKARYPVFVTMRLRAGLRSLRANDTHALVEAAFVAASVSRSGSSSIRSRRLTFTCSSRPRTSAHSPGA